MKNEKERFQELILRRLEEQSERCGRLWMALEEAKCKCDEQNHLRVQAEKKVQSLTFENDVFRQNCARQSEELEKAYKEIERLNGLLGMGKTA